MEHDDVKDPSELSEAEAEARQTGESIEEVLAKSSEAKTPKGKATRKSGKTSKPKSKVKGRSSLSSSKVPSTKKTSKKSAKSSAKPSKKPVKGAKKPPVRSAKAKVATSAGDRPANKRGPRGNPNPKREAHDGGKFGREIARARKVKTWTQAELARRVGCSQPGIANMEKGTCGVGPLGIKIAKVLGLTVPKYLAEKTEKAT